jgi:hypothetical protein
MRAARGAFGAMGTSFACSGDEVLRVHLARAELQRRLGVEPSTDTVERRGDVLAHRG